MSARHRSWRAVGATVVVVCALSGAAGAGTRIQTTAQALAVQRTDTRPCTQPTAITQSADGYIDGCIELGVARPGRHAVELLDRVFTGPSKLRRAWRGPSVRVRLSPSSGPPGTVVSVRATLSRALPAATRRHLIALGRDVLGLASWDGPDGLMLDARHFRWISSRSFQATVTVPGAPWIQRTPDPTVLGLRSGRYPISVACVTGNSGCADASEGAAGFTLTVVRVPSWCRTPADCARLNASPASAPAGAIVRVSGYAPLLEFDNGADAFIGTAQLTAGSRGGPRFAHGRAGQVTERIVSSALTVLGRPYLEQLGRIRPHATVLDGETQIAAAPADTRLVAWCATGAIELSDRGHRIRIPTRGVIGALRRMHALAAVSDATSPPSCADVLPLSATTVLAAFLGGLPQEHDQIPPFADYALETRDGGRSWSAVPTPAGVTAADFGGFRSDGTAAEAIFARSGPRNDPVDATHPLLERTAATGAHWSTVALRCPSSGPCVTLGPFLPGNCAQGLSTQYVLRATADRRRWLRSPILEPNMFACGDAQLSSVGDRRELLVNALSAYPLQLSTDGGAHWRNLSMPVPLRLPDPSLPGVNEFGPGGITLLPDGGLLLTGGEAYAGGWQLLEPGALQWCDVAGASAHWQFDDQASRITLVGRRLLWLTYGRARHNAPQPLLLHTLPLAAVRCG